MIRLETGDSLQKLQELEENSVDCIVTSPPYWGLRDYGNEKQLGLERTPEEYVNNLCNIFDECYRVLKDTGTMWVNLGDSYSNGKGRKSQVKQSFENAKEDKYGELLTDRRASTKGHPVLKDKDLVGIPWRVAFELQRRGWYLRQDIIWAKPNPLPESVKDRLTKSHEHIFLLTKSPKYYFDYEAIREDAPYSKTDKRKGRSSYGGKIKQKSKEDKHIQDHFITINSDGKRRKRDVWFTPVNSFKGAHFATYSEKLIEPCVLAGCPEGGTVLDPFSGAGTTGVVAMKQNKNYIGIELNEEYQEIAKARIEHCKNLPIDVPVKSNQLSILD